MGALWMATTSSLKRHSMPSLPLLTSLLSYSPPSWVTSDPLWVANNWLTSTEPSDTSTSTSPCLSPAPWATLLPLPSTSSSTPVTDLTCARPSVMVTMLSTMLTTPTSSSNNSLILPPLPPEQEDFDINS